MGSASDDVEVRSLPLELAEGGASGRDHRAGREIGQRQVEDRRVTGFEHPDGAGGLGDDNSSEAHHDTADHLLDPWRAGVVPHAFLTGAGDDPRLFHDATVTTAAGGKVATVR